MLPGQLSTRVLATASRRILCSHLHEVVVNSWQNGEFRATRRILGGGVCRDYYMPLENLIRLVELSGVKLERLKKCSN